MSSFISKSACRGRRPASQLDFNGRKRPHLIAHLLKDRGVARFIVGPVGYGKTSAAVEYAETVFSWVHVFWINCQSPCFIRDLDAGLISQQCRESDADLRLVVFDNVPMLDAPRAERLSSEIDTFLHEACEIIVTCTPTADVYAHYQRDRCLLSAVDLLLTDEELDAMRTSQERAANPASSLPASFRVPMLAWDDSPDVQLSFLKKSFAQEMPGDLMLTIATMFVLGKGGLSDLRRVGQVNDGEMAELLAAYPHLCYDAELQRFESPLFTADDLAQALKRRFEKLVEASSFESREELMRAWADILMRRNGAADRACDVVRAFCPLAIRSEWLHANAFELVKRGCFYSSYQLIASLQSATQKAPASERIVQGALESVCLHVLGDETAAVRVAKRYAFDDTILVDARICCLLVVSRDGSDLLRRQASRTLLELLEKHSRGESQMSFYEWAAHAQCACLDGSEALSLFWEEQFEAKACREALCLTASWLFKSIEVGKDAEGEASFLSKSSVCKRAERYVHDILDDASSIENDFFAASAGISLEEAHERGMDYASGPLSTTALLALRRTEMSILSQRRLYDQEIRSQQLRQSTWAKTHPDSLLVQEGSGLVPAEERSVPVLSVKLFGRFEVTIGGVPVRDGLLKRQNSCTLLALLTINHGREIMRDTLSRAMWPKSDSSTANKNFYTVWSELRKALTLPDGTCPYLVRHQHGCSIETRYVQSDVMRFEEICHELLFGNPDFQEWPSIYSEIERDFSGDFMPSDTTNAMLQNVRTDYHLRLVDALVTAAAAITDAGNPPWGIWFARCALAHDRTREDAYLALMKAQIAADQRTAATLTYLKCRRVLLEELGMDPSPEATRLYERLLDSM